MIEDRPDGLGFRHELARRAIEGSLPVTRVRLLNRAVVEALRMQERPERARLMHHAVAAGDVDTVLADRAAAAREAARAGAHRQALAHLEAVVPYAPRLAPAEQAAVLDDYGWELYNAARFREAVRAGSAAAELYAGLGDSVALGSCLVRVSRHWFMAGETDAAEECAARAVRILEPAGDDAALAQATLYHGAILALAEDPEQAGAVLARADDLARASQRMDLAVLCQNYIGIARVERGDPEGLRAGAREHRRSPARAATTRRRRAATRNLAELLLRAGRLDELERCVTRRAGLHPRARLLVARLQPRRAPLPAAAAHRRLGRRRGGPARGRRRRRRPRDALRLQRALARAPARPPRRSGRRGDARRGVGAGAAPSPAARPGLRRDRARRVGVAGGPPGDRRTRRRRPAAAHAASRRGPVPRRAAALPRARRPAGGALRRLPAGLGRGAAGRLARGGGGVAGGRRPVRDRARAGRVRRGRGATGEALRILEDLRAEPAAAACASACARWGPRSRAGRVRSRAPTRPA